jgi:hypothetical protein
MNFLSRCYGRRFHATEATNSICCPVVFFVPLRETKGDFPLRRKLPQMQVSVGAAENDDE